MGTGSNPQNFQIGAVGGYTGNAGNLNFGQTPYSSGFVSSGRTFMPGGPPGTAGGPPIGGFGFLDSLSFGQQYGIASGFQAIGAGITEYNRAKLEQQSYEWKAEIYKRQWELKQRQIEDRRITGKKEEDALRRKYETLKRKITPTAGKRGILVGGGSVMDILAGVEVTELADRGLLKTNVEKDIYGMKVGQWSDKVEETMYRRRASMTSPGRSAGMTMLSSAMQSGMKYWQYKNSMPGSLA